MRPFFRKTERGSYENSKWSLYFGKNIASCAVADSQIQLKILPDVVGIDMGCGVMLAKLKQKLWGSAAGTEG